MDKEKINEWVLLLKKKRIIKFDVHIAKALGYSKAHVSQVLSGEKALSYSFVRKFKERYGEYLNEVDFDTARTLEEKIESLEAEVRILKDTVISLSSQISGKQASLVSAEIDAAIRVRKEGKVIKLSAKKH